MILPPSQMPEQTPEQTFQVASNGNVQTNKPNDTEGQSGSKKESKLRKITYRILVWLFFTVAISSVPLGVLAICRQITGYTDGSDKYILEILIITITVASNTLKDIIEDDFFAKNKIVAIILLSISLLAIIFPSVLYGIVKITEEYNNGIMQIISVSAISSGICGLTIRVGGVL